MVNSKKKQTKKKEEERAHKVLQQRKERDTAREREEVKRGLVNKELRSCGYCIVKWRQTKKQR